MDISSLTGEKVFIRTVTHYYIGRVAESPEGWILLEDAAWIADTGRFSTALSTGELEEVEPYPGSCLVALGAVVDVCGWAYALPRTVK